MEKLDINKMDGIQAHRSFFEIAIKRDLITFSNQAKLFYYEATPGNVIHGGFFSPADPEKVSDLINLAVFHNLYSFAQYFLRLVIPAKELKSKTKIKYWGVGRLREGKIRMADFLEKKGIHFNIPLQGNCK